jgi:mannose-1-phosphate guanylyltransferase
MSIHNNYVAIMAGGIGSRFWPVSRNVKPKQFLDLVGTGRSLIQSTYERFKQICPAENIYIVTHSSYVDLVKEQLPELPAGNILEEPSRKNTAACAAYVAWKLHDINPKANIIMSPSDHLILEERIFEKVCFEALDFVARNEALITLGIRPTRPDTGYGYIQYEQETQFEKVYRVKTFTEKPSLELANTFLKSGDFLWNAGIFVWKAETAIQAFRKFVPEMAEVFDAFANALNTNQEKDAIETIYPQCTNTSIDYAIMEKAHNVFVIPSYFGWSDLGTWQSAYENSDKDYLGNAVYGNNVMIIDANQCMVVAPEKKLVVLQGLEDYIVIDTKDVLLICEKKREQQIKDYVNEVKRNKGDKFL